MFLTKSSGKSIKSVDDRGFSHRKLSKGTFSLFQSGIDHKVVDQSPDPLKHRNFVTKRIGGFLFIVIEFQDRK